MGVFGTIRRKLFTSADKDPFYDKSPKLIATPAQPPAPRFELPSNTSSASSSSSRSSASIFWNSATPTKWSPRQYIPARIRKIIGRRRIAVLACGVLALLVWIVPPPQTWGRQVVHINVPHHLVSPYQVIRPIAEAARKHPPDPRKWLDHNSDNKFAVSSTSRFANAISSMGRASKKPRAALISLVRNSELE
ncbi:MAG: hypothetical protein Q9183_007046, partial [Haloplaca sp. 2 TL-2023]